MDQIDETVLNHDADALEIDALDVGTPGEADLEVMLDAEQQAYGSEISAYLMARERHAKQGANEDLAKKWATEIRYLTAPSSVKALHEAQFDPRNLETLAIYATQKLRRLVQSYLGVNRIDPYTKAVLDNAVALRDENKALSNALIMASLSTKLKTSQALPVRRVSAPKTASTQACSSRKALLALGAARIEDKSFLVDFGHPFIARAVGAA